MSLTVVAEYEWIAKRQQHVVKHVFLKNTNHYENVFRGAVNALDQVECSRAFHLTESFRFGPEVGYLASVWLEERKASSSPFIR